jgi:hypothetical protein
MTVPRAPQQRITQAIDATQWAVSGDDADAAAETRKRARLVGPDCVAFLNYVMRTDGFASAVQRVRAASTLLEVGQFLTFEAKTTGLFPEAEEANGADEQVSS